MLIIVLTICHKKVIKNLFYFLTTITLIFCLNRVNFNVFAQTVQPVTDTSFKIEVLESKLPVLVDFWTPWCGPCRLVAPVVDDIAQQYEGKVKVVKINTDENPQIASQYEIRSIPTLMIFKDGQRVDMLFMGNDREDCREAD